MKQLLAILLSFFLLLSCNVAGDDNSGTGTGSEITVSRGELQDADGNVIGNILSANTASLILLTSKDYIVQLEWDGVISNLDTIDYTEENLQGTPFCRSRQKLNSKSVQSGDYGSLFIFKDVENGLPKADITITQSKSYMREGTSENNTFTLDSTSKAYVLKEVTKAEIGYPESITLPLKVVFK